MNVDPQLAWTFIVAVIAAAIAWGKTSVEVSNLKRAVARIESKLFGLD